MIGQDCIKLHGLDLCVCTCVRACVCELIHIYMHAWVLNLLSQAVWRTCNCSRPDTYTTYSYCVYIYTCMQSILNWATCMLNRFEGV